MKLGIWVKCLVFLLGYHDLNAVTRYLVSEWNPGVENNEELGAESRFTQCWKQVNSFKHGEFYSIDPKSRDLLQPLLSEPRCYKPRKQE